MDLDRVFRCTLFENKEYGVVGWTLTLVMSFCHLFISPVSVCGLIMGDSLFYKFVCAFAKS